ncbi:MAG: fibronectin type III domain-containing protein [Paludibacteraceae bacterium]|nr:fibronectin type III domain-containing protein [Paludibacteraceae bacterium]
MKKFFLLVMLMAILAPWTVLADELTVCDGTATSSYVPFYSLYADYGARSQFIIPADSLSDLAGGTITAMTFYSSTASATYDQEFTIYLKEVANETFASDALEDWSQLKAVYVGSLTLASNEMHFDLDLPFAYQGNNLMVGVQITQFGNSCPNLSWRGVNPGTGVYTAAYNKANGSHVWDQTVSRINFIPKTTFEYSAGGNICEKPSQIDVVSVSTDSATIEWANGSGLYNLQYKKASDQNWITALGSTSLLSTNLTGLDAATAYQVRVQSICSGDSSSWRATSFTTECGLISSFPWSEDFESYNASSSGIKLEDPCWKNEHLAGTGTYFFEVYQSSYSGTGSNTTKTLRLHDMSDGTLTKLTLPAMNLPGNNYLFSLDVFRNATGSSYPEEGIRVFVSADGDLAGATELAFISRNFTQTDGNLIPAETSADWYTYEIPLRVSGQCYIILRGESKYGSATYMDNFIVKKIPTCLKVTNLVANNITTTSAELGWTAGGSESAWNIYYKKSTDSAFVEVDNVTQNPYTLNGLTASSKYQFYVVAKCSETDISEPSAIAGFSTACDAIATLPWSENFDDYAASTGTSAPASYPDDDLPLCWQILNRSANTSTYPQAFISSSSAYAVSGNCLFFKSSSTTPLYAILPEFVEDIAGLQLTFTYRNEGTANSNGTLHVGYMTDPKDTTTFTSVLTCPKINSLTEKEVSFVGAPAGSFIVFKYVGAANNYYLSIDNVSVDFLPACAKPSVITVSDIASHTAVLGWNAGAGETAWQIMLNNDTTNLINAATNPFTLTGLAAETAFVAKVRANCGGSYSEWSTDSVKFTTLVACPAPVFKADSIKNIGAHSADIAWGGNSESYIISYRTSAYVDAAYAEDFESGIDGWTLVDCASGTGVTSNMFRFYYNTNPPQYLISPEMNGITEGLQLRFYYRAHSSNYEESFAVGFSTTDNSTSSFTFGPETFTTITEWTLYTVDVPAGTKYFCIKYTANDKYYLYLDDITIGTEVPAGEWVVESGITANSKQLTGLAAETYYDVKIQGNCGDEGLSAETATLLFRTISDCETPAGLAADSITLTSAVISWETYGLTEFNLRYSADGENFQQILATAMPCKLTGLTAATAYTVQVQATCNTEDWSEPLIFKTAYGIPFAPEELDMTEWSKKSGLAANVFAGEPMVSISGGWGICNANDAFEAQHLRINNYGTNTKSWILSPVIDATNIVLAEGEKLKLSFRVALAKYDYSGSVAQLPDTTGIDDKFIVAFAIDSCTTWLEANATIWNNADGNAIYNYIPNMGMDVNLDFSAAAGHMVQFAFYAESTVANADNDLHVGNIVLDVISNTTDIQAIEASDKAIKFVENGQIYIRFNGVTYDALGRLIRK